MEELSANLQPYKELLGTVATVVTIAQFFSGVFICNDVYKRSSTKGISAMPFIGGTVIGILVLKYALILQDKAMFQVNVAAIFLNGLYLIFYHLYSCNKWTEIYKPTAYGVGLIGIMFGYLNWEEPDYVEYRYGLIVTVLMLLLMGSPLFELNDIISKKDASNIPFPLTFMGFIVSGLWLLYGLILLNYFMMIQNALGMMLCASQLFLLFKFPSKKTGSKKRSKKSKIN